LAEYLLQYDLESPGQKDIILKHIATFSAASGTYGPVAIHSHKEIWLPWSISYVLLQCVAPMLHAPSNPQPAEQRALQSHQPSAIVAKEKAKQQHIGISVSSHSQQLQQRWPKSQAIFRYHGALA
jgi:hypothetical protein